MCQDGDSLSEYGLGLGQEDTACLVKLTPDDVYSLEEGRDSRGKRPKGREERDCPCHKSPTAFSELDSSSRPAVVIIRGTRWRACISSGLVPTNAHVFTDRRLESLAFPGYPETGLREINGTSPRSRLPASVVEGSFRGYGV